MENLGIIDISNIKLNYQQFSTDHGPKKHKSQERKVQDNLKIVNT